MVTINAPLHEGTKGLFNDELLGKMKKGSYLVNTARGAIVDRDSLVRAVDSGHLQGGRLLPTQTHCKLKLHYQTTLPHIRSSWQFLWSLHARWRVQLMIVARSGYAGDVWYPQPAPADHPWRKMPRHAMTPHYSGTTLDAQVSRPAG